MRALRSSLALAAFAFASACIAQVSPQASTTALLGKHADFAHEQPGRDARHVADWVVDSGDSNRMPFVIIDKTAAHVFVFDADGHLRGSAAALLGIAKGDHSAPGVGDRELSAIRVQDRTTPAGRFEAALGRNYHKKEILWIDYDAAISMHPVINTKPMERRPHRLATPTPLDNRISFGCVNVPIPFFETVISPTFKTTSGIVYVLPEVSALDKVFAMYDVDARALVLAKAVATATEFGTEQ